MKIMTGSAIGWVGSYLTDYNSTALFERTSRIFFLFSFLSFSSPKQSNFQHIPFV